MQINKIPIGYIIAPLWDNAEALKYQQGPYSFCCAPILPPPVAADSINVHIGSTCSNIAIYFPSVTFSQGRRTTMRINPEMASVLQ